MTDLLNNIHQIPEEMKIYRQFVCWRYEDRDGKQTKVPINPNTGLYASIKKPDNWNSFDIAVAGAKTHPGHGVGFVLTPTDPYTFIDLDDPKGNEEEIKRVIRIYSNFNSYTEFSPSGKGLHIILKGHIPKGCRKGCVELYSSERYMTMTGNMYGECREIMKRQSLIQELWSQMKGFEYPELDYVGLYAKPKCEKDVRIYHKSCDAKNGKRFLALWKGKKILDELGRDQSPSGADMALVCMLLRHTRDPEQIERLWMKSPLGQRAKVRNREDYRKLTIKNAFEKLYWFREQGGDAYANGE